MTGRRNQASAGYPDAVRATRDRAVAMIGERASTPDRSAAERVVQTLNEPGAPGAYEPGFREDLARVGVGDLEDRHDAGSRAVPLLVIIDALAPRLGGGGVELRVLADALTALVVAGHSATADLDVLQLVVHAVREYLAATRQPADPTLVVPRELLATDARRRDWEDLAGRIPWVRWLAPEDLDPIGGVRVGPDELVDLLVLLRPRVEQRFANARPVDRPLPARFGRLYRCSVDLDPALLDVLAGALSPVLDDPGRAGQKLQPLQSQLPDALDTAARARVREAEKAATDPEYLLALRIDTARVLLVNLSNQASMQMQVGARHVTVAPYAIEEVGAADYCTEPVDAGPGADVRMGRWRVPLDADEAPMADTMNLTLSVIPPELFRGREAQQALLRAAMSGRGPRAGSLIRGPRRAGKSTLMEHVGQDSRLRLSLSLDVANHADPQQDFAEWHRKVTRELLGQVRRHLPDLALEVSGGDFVEALIDLDEALHGSAPVGLLLDELDVLLLPESGSSGLRTAGRLGNRAFHNLVLIGTVQRFHREVHQFKNWQIVDCPADLSWADGVSYFLGPLHKAPKGPRVEWLTRAGVTPRDFADHIAPRVGLRPYFWGRLRGRLEAAVRVGGRSRLVGADAVRRAVDELVTEDPHLNHVLEDGARMDAAERRRQDVFSVDERRILLRFATMDRVGGSLSVQEAQRVGGAAAVSELVDRAWLTYDRSQERLHIAVPIYQEYLRSRVSDLREVTPDDRPARSRPAVPAPRAGDEQPARRAGSARRAAAEGTDARPAAGSSPNRSASGSSARSRAAGRPSATPPRAKQPTGHRPAPPAQVPRPSAGDNGSARRPAPASPAASPEVEKPTKMEIEIIRAVLRVELEAQDPLLLSRAGHVIRKAVPRIGPANDWAGAGRLTDFFEAHLPELTLEDGGSDRVVRPRRGVFRRFWSGS